MDTHQQESEEADVSSQDSHDEISSTYEGVSTRSPYWLFQYYLIINKSIAEPLVICLNEVFPFEGFKLYQLVMNELRLDTRRLILQHLALQQANPNDALSDDEESFIDELDVKDTPETPHGSTGTSSSPNLYYLNHEKEDFIVYKEIDVQYFENCLAAAPTAQNISESLTGGFNKSDSLHEFPTNEEPIELSYQESSHISGPPKQADYNSNDNYKHPMIDDFKIPGPADPDIEIEDFIELCGTMLFTDLITESDDDIYLGDFDEFMN
ncbi:hypothetical protein BN7_214 [Wickerhamomyces ciferrii]|uniref:Uncharacterized protein n=1 Tax=Wickerhamomyces ciferrii (strain ATCC 14091 / BCRC 22168 / CBS 111 / JCM 3599 / NBRC 0793 / NRRL Y-1031 F-60-10) TaxID=1206466 RepID=K0K740_WICCF|nr:uncharacterized protein BN7_214 [Wickerhamomyces ciferrii]CCH40680.1 hypothetical protein BN7_214 [Wickerhamomyces ciferrii]